MTTRPSAPVYRLLSVVVKTASIIAAAVLPAWFLGIVFAFPAFFVIASLVIVLAAAVLWWSGRRRAALASERPYYFLAFTLALLLLVWEPMITLHAHYAPESVSFLVNNLSYSIAGLVLLGLAFIRAQ